MKKPLLLAVFCIFASAIFAQAPFLYVSQPDSNNTTNHSAIIPVSKAGGTAAWSFKLRYMEQDSSYWVDADTTQTYGANYNGPVQKMIALPHASRTYVIGAVGYNANHSDTAVSLNTVTITTKPDQQNLSISFLDTIPGLPESGYTFAASAVGWVNAVAYGVNTQNGATVTNILSGLTGNVTDTLYRVNAAGDLNSPVQLIIKSQDGTAMVASQNVAPAFYAPQLAGPQMETATPFKNQDSINISLNVTSLGNGGTVVLSYWLRDVISGNYEITPTNQSVTTTGTIFIGKKVASWKTNRLFEFHALIANVQGLSDTVDLFIRTDQVPQPNAVIMSVPVTQTTWSIATFAATTGLWDSSEIRKAYHYRNGSIIDSMNLAITDTGTITFSGVGMAGDSYTDYIRLVNKAGISFSTLPFPVILQTPAPNGSPTYASITDISPSEVRLEGVVTHVTAGNSSSLLVKTQNMNTGAITTKVAMSNNTTDGPVPSITISNLEGNLNYCHTLVDSMFGVLMYGTQKCSTTIAPIAPLLSDITQDNNATTDDVLAVNFITNSNGYQGILEASLYEDNIPVASMAPTSVGTGSFNFPFSWNNLSPNTEYKVFGQLETSTGSNQSSVTKYFWTDAFTGVSEIPKNAYGMRVRVNAITGFGQEIMTGTCNDVFQALAGSGLLVAITPIDETGQRIGSKVYKHGFLKN